MTRWAARVEYQGGAYAGWQRLPHNRSVQAELESALSAVAAEPVQVYAAGRTDAGVHALGQVVHFDSAARRNELAWLLGGNIQLPPDISLRWVRPVADDFHARHRALQRRYRYLIHNARGRSALSQGLAAFWPRALDAAAMHEAGQLLLGERDFSAFRDSQCQSPTPMRCVSSLLVRRSGEFVAIDIAANAFLHHMVRNISGSLIEIGQGKQPMAWLGEVLTSRDRRRAGMTAPAQGLTFIGPDYPPEYGLPPSPQAWFPGTMPG